MAKKKDFEKQKLKVGKKKPERSNATATTFSTKSLTLRSQHKAPDLAGYLALLRHHHAPTRRQALANIRAELHLHERVLGDLLDSICPLAVDVDRQVRHEAGAFLGAVDGAALAPHVARVLTHVHAAMTHLTPAVRADSTRFLDALLAQCPEALVRVGFAPTLQLYFPLLGWPMSGSSQAGSVAATLALGRLAPAARAAHLNSLASLLARGLSDDKLEDPVLFHSDTHKFLIPSVSDPFSLAVTEDAEARREAIRLFEMPLAAGLQSVVKEGGDAGRMAARILTELQHALGRDGLTKNNTVSKAARKGVAV